MLCHWLGRDTEQKEAEFLLAGGASIAETEYEKSLVSTVLKLHPKLGDKLWLKEDSEGK